MNNSYRVTHPIHRNNRMYNIGDSIILDDESAHRLKHCIDLKSKTPVEGETEADAGLQLIATLQEENTTLQGKIDNLNGQLASRESDLDEITAELTTLRDEKAGLESELTSVKILLTTAQDDNKKIAGQVDQLKKALAKKK
ncbi:MAG: hypothetical protein M0T70_02905 [Geobacteraceae bacterium]|nr:hypothetical protein [Geobacteraceae bacterium]